MIAWGFITALAVLAILLAVVVSRVAVAEGGRPDAAHSLDASFGESGELEVSREAASGDGDAEIAGYRVQWKEAASSWDAPEDVSEDTVFGIPHTITGPTAGVEHPIAGHPRQRRRRSFGGIHRRARRGARGGSRIR